MQTPAKLKKQFLKSLFLFLLVVGGLLNCESSFGQTPTFTALTGGIAASPLTAGNTQQAIFGFSASVSGGSITFQQFNIGSNSGTPNACFANGTLVRSPTSTYTGAGTPVGNVAISATSNTTSFTITGLSETVSATTIYYFLVVDVINTSTTACQPYVNSMTLAIDVNNVSYNSAPVNTYNYYNINSGTPYPVSVVNTTTGLTSPSTILTSGTTGLALFGFGITTTASSTFSSIKINSNVATISNYFTNFKLFSNTSNTFTGSTQVTGLTASTSGGYVTFTTAGATLSASTTIKYYFLVADCTVTGSLPVNVQFSFVDGQSSAALTRATPSVASYNDFTAYGNTYNINSTTLTVTLLTGGTTSGTLTANQTGVVCFGFSLASSSNITVSGFNINSTNTAATYFGNGKLYRNATTTYPSSPVQIGTVTFSGNFAVVTGLSEAITGTAQNYFLVADDIAGATSSTIAFNFSSTQTSNAITQSSPIASSYNTFNISGNTLTLPSPTLLVTGENSVATNGITAGNLTYGQTGIVLFGFGVQAFGASFSLATINIKAPGNENSYFSNGSLYRSTSPVFPGGTALYTGIAIPGGGDIHITVTETIPSNTTYYYFFTADYTVANGPAATGYAFSFSTTQSGGNSSIVTNPYATYSYNVTGNGFTIIGTEDWTGGTSTSFTNAANFTLLGGGGGFVPTSTTVVRIGGVNYTNAPLIAANTTIAGITFGSAKVSTLTINSGQTLTLSNNLSVLASSTATVAGSGTLTLSSGSISSTAGSSTLTLNGSLVTNNAGTFTTGASSTLDLTSATLNNSGTFTLGSTGLLNLSTATLANTGTFTLASTATGSAAIGPLVGTNTITGTYSVQRYINGGSGYRGYRLLSSPVYAGTANSNNVYSINYIANSCYITGTTVTTGGIDKAGNPTLYLFRENLTPSQTSFTSGNFRGVGDMFTGTTNITYTMDVDGTGFNIPVGNGYLFFFRGDRSVAPIATETVTSYIPTSTILTAVGTLNTGSITYKNWFTPTVSTLLDAAATGNSSILGYNLAGNPYPSSISWTTVYGASTNVSPIIYEFNPATNQYGFFNESNSTSTQDAGNVIGSGQGFFVIANNTSATLNFTEAAKVTSQPSTLLFAAAIGGTQSSQYIHLKMIKDSMNFDDVVLGFNPQASTKYVAGEDAMHLNGNSPPETLTSLSSDSVSLAGNFMPYPGLNTPQVIRLSATATASGTYKFLRSELVNIPALYEIWLMDNMQKDSLDLRANTTYAFDIDNTNPASYGANRFQVVVRQNPALGVHLLAFNAAKITTATQVQVSWTVENEANYTTFYVQRSTDNGQTFQSIGSLQSDGLGTYSFIDPSPVTTGQDQYRLQMSDVNNTITYSSVITIQYSDLSNNNIGSNISLYPNPAHDLINLSVTGNNISTGPYTITITNSIGAVVNTSTSSQPAWQNNVSGLLPGTYFLQVVDNNTKTIVGRSKFIKL